MLEDELNVTRRHKAEKPLEEVEAKAKVCARALGSIQRTRAPITATTIYIAWPVLYLFGSECCLL